MLIPVDCLLLVVNPPARGSGLDMAALTCVGDKKNQIRTLLTCK